MTIQISRVLDDQAVRSLEEYVGTGGGAGLQRARTCEAGELIAAISASGLRGRGGAGFPTGTKWETVRRYRSPTVATSVVVNAAEGEPGSFKDRELLQRNPYRMLEGALIAARAVDAAEVRVALKASFTRQAKRLRSAIDEIEAAGWSDGIHLEVFEGPEEYLFGEETGLLEALAGRPPFPRVAPPFRHGVVELDEGDAQPPADIELASPGDFTEAPPTLVNNVETLANVGGILAHGEDWFRQVGTPESPGTIVCTVSGATRRHGVGEFPMGTPLRSVIEELGGGPRGGGMITGVLSGVAHPILPADRLDTPLTYEHMQQAGSGLGAAGFIVFDDQDDMVAVAQGVSWFLAVESCGQCMHCKQDGLALSGILDRLRASEPAEDDLNRLEELVPSVAEGARCYLAHQHQRVVDSLLRLFPDDVIAHGRPQAPPAEPLLIAPIAELDGDRAVLRADQPDKQPDWRYGGTYSGQSPADRLGTPPPPEEGLAG